MAIAIGVAVVVADITAFVVFVAVRLSVSTKHEWLYNGMSKQKTARVQE